MARAIIPIIKAVVRNEPSEAVLSNKLFTPLTADGGEINWQEKDSSIVILAQNTATAEGKVTLIHGDGSSAMMDMDIPVPASSTVCFNIDSARFKNLTGDNRGKVLVSGPTTLSLAVFSTP